MDQSAGMLRLVAGLGTRAVDPDRERLSQTGKSGPAGGIHAD